MKRAKDEVDASAGKKAKSDGESGGSGGSYKSRLLATLDDGWKKALAPEFDKPYFDAICKSLEAEEKAGKQVFPPLPDIFNAFNYTSLDNLRVVILGQDPYHDDGQAHGLCFSVRKGVPPPPSLKNIYKELATDIAGFKAPSHGNLEAWARQGILLLNASLTVRAHEANSHKDFGWQTFTDAVIAYINAQTSGVVFILWGGFAQKKGKSIDAKKHHVIKAAHPSPLSAKSFFGCKVFSQTNACLKSKGRDEIDWNIPA